MDKGKRLGKGIKKIQLENPQPPLLVGRAFTPEELLKMQYSSLSEVLEQAFDRCARGKGKERHADTRSFLDQDMIRELTDLGITPAIAQIRKKAKESLRLDKDAQIKEFLDVIVYAASAIIVLQDEMGD